MRFRKLFAAAAASFLIAVGAAAQTAPDAGTAAAAGATSATGAPSKKSTSKSTPKKKKGASKKSKKGKKATKPPPKSDIDEETRKALEAAQPPAPPAPAPVAPAPEMYAGDDDPPVLTHTPAAKAATKGKPFPVTAHATDPSGVFGPVLYLRKKGMPASEYIPIRMSPSKTAPGDYTVDVPAALVSADALEYYLEAWDNAGNGPSRAGSPETPFPIKVEEEKKIIVRPAEITPPTNVTIKQKGAPPAITHTAVTQATRGSNIELNARLAGDSGVQGPTVMFRRVGEKEYKALPMGNLGGDDYTATVPAQMATLDIEYYLEAFDKYGNGPGRSGSPNLPYTIKVLEPGAGGSLTSRGKDIGPAAGSRAAKAPFRPNPGRSAAWLFMGGFVGGLAIAGGEALGAWQAHNAYTHTFEYEGRLDPGLLSRANAYGNRAKTAAIVSGASLAVAVVLFFVFPERPDNMAVGSGGDVGLGVKF
jgi:hypothetical protein